MICEAECFSRQIKRSSADERRDFCMAKKKAAHPDQAAYTKAYRAANPDRVLQWRITAAIKLLKSKGYAVIEPEEGAGDGERKHI